VRRCEQPNAPALEVKQGSQRILLALKSTRKRGVGCSRELCQQREPDAPAHGRGDDEVDVTAHGERKRDATACAVEGEALRDGAREDEARRREAVQGEAQHRAARKQQG